MRGEERDDPAGAAHQPAHVLADRVQDRLRDVEHAQVPRFDELRAQLQAEAFQWDNKPLAHAILALQSAGRELQFLPLRQGWIARLLGRHRAAHAQFVAAHGRIAALASEVASHLARLAECHDDRSAGPRGALLEIDKEMKSLATAVDEGVTWLQHMCTQLAQARHQGREEPQLESLVERAQSDTQQFKRLQAMEELVHGIVVRGNTILARRAALIEQVRADVALFQQAWTQRLGQLVEELKAGRSAVPLIPKAIESHDDLMKRLGATVDGCNALQHEEHLFAQQLELLQAEIGR